MPAQRPLYQQLIDSISNYISENKLTPGDKIPTEQELSQVYKVSRATVRQAIQELVNNGILLKMHGKGTFIAQPKHKMGVGSFYSFSDLVQNNHFDSQTQILCFQEIHNPDDKVCRRLQLSPNEAVFYLSRLRCIDNNPVLLENTYVPKKLVPFFDIVKIEQNGLYNYLNHSFGIGDLEGIERFTAYNPTIEEKAILKIRDSDPCIRIRRLFYYLGKPIEYTFSILKNGTIQLEANITSKK
ncbi:MAG: GntR family transcriptional regulator [Herbinix sp.]|nr:GntR family transcriptional regulator [Herbinix sp.]